MILPLKVTTDFSLLQSLIKVSTLISFCVDKKIDTCGICDTNLFGAVEFYKTAVKNNIKPIIGLRLKIDGEEISLYAKNYGGYKKLLKINTILCEREILKEEVLKIIDNDVVVVVPFESKNLYNIFQVKYVFISFKDTFEYKNAIMITKNVVYMNLVRSFSKEDLKYLKYLEMISDTKIDKYDNDYYIDIDNLEFQDSTKYFASLFNLVIPFNERYIPKYKEDVDSFDFLKNLAYKGLSKRLNGNIDNVYEDRLNYELNVINKMRFVDYFLIVYDYVLYAKKNKILVGPGRGSAAGSLVSYVIGITDIDPIKYNLLFERFLNYERVSMPDIDIDFDNTRREEVINYVKNKYGFSNVSGGMTYSTFRTKLVLREVSRILKIDNILLEKFLKEIDRDKSLKDNLNNKNVLLYINSYEELKKVYEISMKLENLKKNISTHAAGIVIGDRPLDEIIPMYKNGNTYLSGIQMEFLEDMGLLKMDFLSLKNLSIINNIITKIPCFNINKIPLEDEEVYKLFKESDTDGIFQFETATFKSMLKKYRPRNFNELVASIALVRPGPSKELETYIKRKNRQEAITYYHESLKDILKETYGVIVYQEQVISILVKMAKFTYAQADNIRRAMSKKKMDIILKEKGNFIKRSVLNGYDEKLSEDIFDHILSFASYGFNKAHSVSYAYISYAMAYLKVHYHNLFMFELLNNSLGNIEKVKAYLSDLKKNGAKIYPVSINYSKEEFNYIDGKIILPFKMIKNLRKDLIEDVLKERSNGKFTDIYDVFRRTYKFMNRSDYELFINALLFSEFKINTNTLLNNLDALINYGELSSDLGEGAYKPEIIYYDSFDKEILRQNELNCYGFYVSNHPASKYNGSEFVKINDLNKHLFERINIGVLIEFIRYLKTKKGDEMAFLLGSDETGEADFVVFPRVYNLFKDIKKGDLVKIYGTVSKRFDKVSVVVNNVVKE